MSILAELWTFMRARKKYWLAPIMLMLVVFGGLIILAGVILVNWPSSGPIEQSEPVI